MKKMAEFCRSGHRTCIFRTRGMVDEDGGQTSLDVYLCFLVYNFVSKPDYTKPP